MLRREVQVVVVDNGSENAPMVEAAAKEAGCRLIFNSQNRGIAAALNQGAALAQAEQFEWLATFDQDSLIPPGAIASNLNCYALHPGRERVASMGMNHRDRGTGRGYHKKWSIIEDEKSWRSVRSSITSGSMVRMDVMVEIGLFDESLFIDAVDHDLCMKMRHLGYLIIENKDVIMVHSVGNSESRRLFGREFAVSNYPPIRQYYFARNLLEVIRRSIFVDAVWSWRAFLHLGSCIAKVIVYERNRILKIIAISEGIADFVLRRFGPRRTPVG